MGSVTVVRASAGSGKTYRLAYEYIRRVIENPALYRHILAVTFTNKATEEMKRRIVDELNALAGGRPGGGSYMQALERELGLDAERIRRRAAEARTKILHDYSHFTVLTIDKFFQRIIRSFVRELGLDLNFTLELQTDSLLEAAADRMIDDMGLDKRLYEWITGFMEEKIEANKQWKVRDEIVGLGRQLFTERFQSRALPASTEEFLKIAGETAAQTGKIKKQLRDMAGRILALASESGLQVADFAYGLSGVMGYVRKVAEGAIVPYGERVRKALDSEEGWYGRKSPAADAIRTLTPALQPLLQELCDAYDRNARFLQTAELLRENLRSFVLLTDLAAKVDELCREQNLLPISETSALLTRLIEGNDTPFIYEKAGNTFSHFMIDEFQDTSAQQWENFVPLLQNAVAQSDRSPVLLVGDVKQSIYRWRGGDWRILGGGVQELFEQVRNDTLGSNFRSEGAVVRFNNTMIGRCVEIGNRALNESLEEARQADAISSEAQNGLTDMLKNAYEGHAQQPERPADGGYVRVTVMPGAEDPEAKPVFIALVEELQDRGFGPEEIAVLVRTNGEGEELAAQLLNYKAAHPESPYCYDLVTQEALTIGHAPVARFVIACFTLASRPEDTIARALYNQFLHKPMEEPLSAEGEAFVRSLRLLSLEEAFEELLLRYDLHERGDDVAYIQALQDQIHAFASGRIADIPLFLKWWEETGQKQSLSLPERSRALTIITIHKSKGLEYNAVIIPRCDWTLVPKSRSLLWAHSPDAPFDALGDVPLNWKNDLAGSHFAEAYHREKVLTCIDNINLFYVAATRARQELHIFLHGAGKESISKLIGEALAAGGSGDLAPGELRQEEAGGSIVYAWGTPCRKAAAPPTAAPATTYPVRRSDARIRLRFGSQRYFPEDERPTLSPRDYGMLMHRLFEQLADHTRIAPELDRWQANGLLSQQERDRLHHYIMEAFENPLIRSWFDTKWEVVRNESGIIVPGDAPLRRPDRVLTKGAEAIVVDYKFGQLKKSAYATQIRDYMELLHRMGYRNVRGYLWYVQRQEVEEVPPDTRAEAG